MARLGERGVVFKDAWFTRWGMLPHVGVMGPLPDPRMPPTRPGYPNPRAYLDDLWNPEAVMPASEFDRELKGAFMARGDNLVLEVRGMPLFWPGWRIGYGLHPILDLPSDPRAGVVAQALVAHLTARWRDVFKAPGKEHMRPVPRDRDWTEDRVSKVRCGTRVGYTFSIESVQLLDWPAPPVCRFREAELFEAVLTAASELALAPVVTWQRFGKDLMMGPLRKPEEVVIQLWERGGEHGSHPDLDESLDPDDDDYDDD
jgi:hypothetical protein